MLEEEFCQVDLWAAEAYLTALDADEKVMLEMLHRGDKIHNWMFDETFKTFPEEVKKYNFKYKDAKQVVHLSNYGGEAQKMQQENHLPLFVCQWMSDHYHGTFPGIRRRMKRIEEEIRSTRSLRSMLGRQKIFFGIYNKDLLNQAYAWPSQSVIGELTLIALTKLYWMGVLHNNITKVIDIHNGTPPIRLLKSTSIPWTYPALNTHDGIAIRCFKGNRDVVTESVRKAFNIPMKKNNLEVVIPVEIGWSDNFNDMNDIKVLRY